MLGKIDDMASLTKGRENKEEKRGKEEEKEMCQKKRRR